MRIPANSFYADDMALCRAHGAAVDESREARALLRWADAVAPLAAINLTVRAFEVGVHMPADLPMPPSYDEDFAEWLKMPRTQQTAAQAAQQNASAWRRGADIPVSERVGLWHVGIYSGEGSPARPAHALKFDNESIYRMAAPGTKAGDPYDESSYTAQSAKPADAGSAASGA